jgi:hypothetical protein
MEKKKFRNKENGKKQELKQKVSSCILHGVAKGEAWDTAREKWEPGETWRPRMAAERNKGHWQT